MWKFLTDSISGLLFIREQLADANRKLADAKVENSALAAEVQKLTAETATLSAKIAELCPADLPEYEHQILTALGGVPRMEEDELRKKFPISSAKFDLHLRKVNLAGFVQRPLVPSYGRAPYWEITPKGLGYLDQRGLL